MVINFFSHLVLLFVLVAGEKLMILHCLSKERTCGGGKENCRREKRG